MGTQASPPPLVPESRLFNSIFEDLLPDVDLKPQDPPVQPITSTLMSRTAGHANYRVCIPHLDQTYFVRLQPSELGIEDRQDDIDTVKRVAIKKIAPLVPEAHRSGHIRDGRGRLLWYSAERFVDGHPLDTIWLDLTGEQRGFVISEICDVLRKLHSVRVSTAHLDAVRAPGLSIARKGDIQRARYGGGVWGFQRDLGALLHAMSARYRDFSHTSNRKALDLTIVESKHEEVQSVIFFRETLSDLRTDPSVLCHNNLSPQNIIIKRGYEAFSPDLTWLAGIVSWDLAGFFPRAFDLAMQDMLIGRQHTMLSYYLCLKQAMKELVPRSPCNIAIAKTVALAEEHHDRALMRDMDRDAWTKWAFMNEIGLARHADPFVGWAPKVVEYTEKNRKSIEKEAESWVNGRTLTDSW